MITAKYQTKGEWELLVLFLNKMDILLAKRRFRNSVRLVKVSEGRAGPYGGTLSLVQTFSLFATRECENNKANLWEG